MPRLACISVDLDEVDCYTSIYGLPPLEGPSAHAIYDRALPRAAEVFGDLGVAATFFVIGKDAERPENAEHLRTMRHAGHEIGNHSQSHHYDLALRSREEIREEIAQGIAAIRGATGETPRGFRAPGYTMNDVVFDVLTELDVTYDSSVFPCPAYFGAKNAAIAAIALTGRRSRSIRGDPRVLLAPADPYRVGRPYYERGTGVRELPIGVTRDATFRMPYIGTSVMLGGRGTARLLTKAIIGRPLVNLELHGMDFADAREDGLSALEPHLPDLRKPAHEKAIALKAAVETLRDAGYELVTLAEAAQRLFD